MGKRPRDPESGKFLSKEEIEQQKNKLENINTQDDVAIFACDGPGTSGFRNTILTMKPREIKDKNKPGKKGKQIRFKDGRYETKDPDEIDFLLWKCDHPIMYSRIKCVQIPKWYKERQNKKEVS